MGVNQKMKNRNRLVIFSTALILSLVSCRGEAGKTSESVDESELAKALTLAQKSVAFSGSLTSVYVNDGDSYDEGTVDLTIGKGFAEWKKTYRESLDYDVSYDYTFVPNEAGNISFDRLTLENTVENAEFVAPRDTAVADSKKGPLNYEQYLSNPFANLEVSDFELVEGRYYLTEKLQSFEGMMGIASISEYHFYPTNILDVSFSMSNGKFADVVITTEPRSDGLYNASEFFYDASFRLIFPGDIEKTEIQPKAHRDEHDTLKAALTDLQQTISGGNYTIHAVDEESSGEYGGQYDNYATADGFYSEFRAALDTYKIGYEKHDDGEYYRYKHYVTGKDMGKVTYFTEETSQYWKQTRAQLEPNFLGFAPEFFVKGKDGSFSTTNGSVVDGIRKITSPFFDRQDAYYVAKKVFFKLNEENKITSWGTVAFDATGSFEDTFTYSLTNIGTTKLPALPIQD